MSHYQSFPNQPGAADSFGKLSSLLLPPLAGKTFLDVGCNEGFFCGYAAFELASRVVGIDMDQAALKTAVERFPHCDFRHGNWDDLDIILKPKEMFDVILMASAIHYANDQTAILASLMRRLNPDGVLILEIGVVENPENIESVVCEPGWHEVRRSIDCRKFPDWKGLNNMLKPYAYKHGGKSVAQFGDPLPRHVFHLCHKKPTAILMTGAPASGKSTLAGTLAAAMNVIKGDTLLCEINARPELYGDLGKLAENINYQRIDKTIFRICEEALECFAELVVQKAQKLNFIYDGYIPAEFRMRFASFLEKMGYHVWQLETPAPLNSLNTLSKLSRIEAKKYQMFLLALESSRNILKLRDNH